MAPLNKPKTRVKNPRRQPAQRPVKRRMTPRARNVPRKRKPAGGSVGFNPKRMAKTLTDLGYDAEISQIERAIEENARREMSAMANLTDWSRQVEDFREQAAGSIANVWNQAIAQNTASDQNIANLFGENAAGEAMASMDAGGDMLRALGAGDQSFMQYIQPILAQQGLDYKNRARGEFAGERRELTGELSDTRSEKSQAYGKNLMDMMQLGWTREGQLFDQNMANLQSKQAQQALDQSAQMFGPQLEAQRLSNQQAKQAMDINAQQAKDDQKLSALQRQQAKQAMRKADIEIRQMGLNQNNLEPADLFKVAQSALGATLTPKGAFSMNPRLALRTALDILRVYGLENDPSAVQAVLSAFEVSLRSSHQRGAWSKWSMKNGQLVYNPGKGPKGPRQGPPAPGRQQPGPFPPK